MKLPKQDNYETAFKLAKEQLLTADLNERCRKSGAVLDESGNIAITYFGEPVSISMPEVTLTYENHKEVHFREQILILHYINKSAGTALAGEWISFKDVPSGEFYYGPFKSRSIDRLAKAFGRQPEKLIEAGKLLGGAVAPYGDYAVTLKALPKAPVLLTVWEGDEEFASTANILFDRGVNEYLVTEDITVLSEVAVTRLIRIQRSFNKEES